MIEEPLFRSTHAALVFAFSFAGNQSPKTPLMSLILNPGDQAGHIGGGKGLVGLDAAAQAGMILAQVDRLPDDQHNVIVVKYCRVQHECRCCGQYAPRDEWKSAIDALSHCIELEGVHRAVRVMMVEKAICGGRLDIDKLCKQYSIGRSTTFKQLADIKIKFRKIERLTMIGLDNVFLDKKLISA